MVKIKHIGLAEKKTSCQDLNNPGTKLHLTQAMLLF